MSEPTRNPFDLIQEDFPSTPSNIYSSRLLNADARFSQDTTSEEQSTLSGYNSVSTTRLTSSSTLSQHAIDSSTHGIEHTTLAMQQLYVSEDESLRSNRVSSPEVMNSTSHLNTSPANAAALGLRRSPVPTGFNIPDTLSSASSSTGLAISPVAVSNTNVSIAISPPASLSVATSPSASSASAAMSANSSSNILVSEYRQGLSKSLTPTMTSPSPIQPPATGNQNPSSFIPIDASGIGSSHPSTQAQGSSLPQQSASHQQPHPTNAKHPHPSSQGNYHPASMHAHAVSSNQQQQANLLAAQAAAAQAQAAGYYVPPPTIYIDQNGQPVYLRVGKLARYLL
jgi:hypothetical protein